MIFHSLQAAHRFVNVYGQIQGLAVVKRRNYKQRKVTLQCNKSRKNVSRISGQRKRKRAVVEKTDCQMNVVVKLEEGQWEISSVWLDHNHELVSTPSLTKFFVSHKNMTEAEIVLSKLLQENRMRPKRIMGLFRKLRGKSRNLMFRQRHVENLKQEDNRAKKNTDIDCTLRYIEKLQQDRPGFIYKMETDETNAVRSIFWTDARARLDYKLYGEVISFDTTYSTNRYNMPFAPIIGINGHAKTIVFGWALLKNQKADTFRWLFETFVGVMEGKKPRLVLTDQCAAMKIAIGLVFSDALHRLCIWHILKNLRDNMGAYMAAMLGMEETISELIMESMSIEEFEEGWQIMLEKYNCKNQEHLGRMWNLRHMFVPAYFRDDFCPFTRSTGRSESFNSNFKDYVMHKDTIETFMKEYSNFQDNIVETENQDRFDTLVKDPVFWSPKPIERHAAKVYTRGIYLKFQIELHNSTAFAVDEIEKDCLYNLRKCFNYEKPEFRRMNLHVQKV